MVSVMAQGRPLDSMAPFLLTSLAAMDSQLRRSSRYRGHGGAAMRSYCRRPHAPTRTTARTGNDEVELSVLVPLAVFPSVTTVPILARAGYSRTAVPSKAAQYLRIRELLANDRVKAASTTWGQAAELMLCTRISWWRKPLIFSAFGRIGSDFGRRLYRFNLEQMKEILKHWSSESIRPEEETKNAGDAP